MRRRKMTVLSGRATVTPWYLSAGVTPIAIWQPKGAASLAASYVNLINPGTYNAAPGVAPTWDTTNGWQFNGSTHTLTTGLVPASGWSAVLRYASAAVSNVMAFGEFTTGNNSFGIIPNRVTGITYYSGQAQTVATGLAAATLAVAGNKAYRNGVDEGVTISAWASTTTYQIYIGGHNSDGITTYRAVNVLALAIYNTTLSPAQVATTTTAVGLL